MVGVTGGWGGGEGINFWASENLSGRVHFEGYSPEWRVLSKSSVQPCNDKRYTKTSIPSRTSQIRMFVVYLPLIDVKLK